MDATGMIRRSRVVRVVLFALPWLASGFTPPAAAQTLAQTPAQVPVQATGGGKSDAAAGSVSLPGSAGDPLAGPQAPGSSGDPLAGPQAKEQDELAARRRELDEMTRSIAVSDQRRAELQAEVLGLGKDTAAITDQLMVSAAKVQENEQKLSDTEARLLRLETDIARQEQKLDGRRDILIEVLGSLQRLSRTPPPAVVIAPHDALSAVRAAILMGAVLPELRGEVDTLLADLTQLQSMRDDETAAVATLKTESRTLEDDRTRLQLLLDQKRRLSATSAADLAAEQARAKDLADKAASLSDLVGKLDRQIRSGSSNGAPKMTPSRPFSGETGRLGLPARGVVVQEFGADTGLDNPASGISIAVRAGARVTSPADANVMYAGPYRAYGQMLILDAGDGYLIVLAGLDHLDVAAGQFVLAGEPIGTMGDHRLASAAQPDMAPSQPVLYVEFRKNGTPIDPSPWWSASDDRKVNG